MPSERVSIHGQWSTRLAFILAATGSAVGLGNIWKFPYITGENGGGAFVLIYLLCVLAIGLPIMMAEVMLGRRGRQSPINTMRSLSDTYGLSRAWQLLGWSGVLAGFLILSYYSVIAGWALAYVFRSGAGMFVGATADGVSTIFTELISDPERLMGWHTLFTLMTVAVVSRGVSGGLERAVRLIMPALFVLLLILLGYAVSTGYFTQGVEFLFAFNFDKVTEESILTAMGHAFFTLSLGMGAIMVYGSYLPQKASIGGTVAIIAIMDTVIALLAGLVIFPIVFANELAPGAGPGLIFQTLPVAFGQMDGGYFFGTLFFVLLVFAAWSSAISLIEPAAAWLVENHGFTRVGAAVWCGFTAWLLGMGTVFSFNIWEEKRLFGLNFFEIMDFLTANIMLPLGGLCIALFVAWRMPNRDAEEELAIGNRLIYQGWRLLVRFVTPIAVLIVFLNVIGVLGYIRDFLAGS